MIHDKLSEVENWLSTPSVFDFLKLLNIDSALDSRDAPEFDDCWMKEFNFLESENIQDYERAHIDFLREKAFKLSFRAMNDSEISSRISDDIELISKSIIFGRNDSWAISYLWSSYRKGEFPQ